MNKINSHKPGGAGLATPGGNCTANSGGKWGAAGGVGGAIFGGWILTAPGIVA